MPKTEKPIESTIVSMTCWDGCVFIATSDGVVFIGSPMSIYTPFKWVPIGRLENGQMVSDDPS